MNTQPSTPPHNQTMQPPMYQFPTEMQQQSHMHHFPTMTVPSMVQSLNNDGVLSLEVGDLDMALQYLRQGIHTHSQQLRPSVATPSAMTAGHMMSMTMDMQPPQQQQPQQQQHMFGPHGPPPHHTSPSSQHGNEFHRQEQTSHPTIRNSGSFEAVATADGIDLVQDEPKIATTRAQLFTHNNDSNNNSSSNNGVRIVNGDPSVADSTGSGFPGSRQRRRFPRRGAAPSLATYFYRKGILLDASVYSTGASSSSAICTVCAILLYNLGLAHHERIIAYEGGFHNDNDCGRSLMDKAVRFYSMALHLVEQSYLNDHSGAWLLRHQALFLGLSNNIGQIYYETGNYSLARGFFAQTNGALTRLVHLTQHYNNSTHHGMLETGQPCQLTLPPQVISGMVFNTRLLGQAPSVAAAA